MVTFVKKDIVQESMKYQKGLASKPEPFKCIEASTEVRCAYFINIFINFAYFLFDPVWGQMLCEPVEVGGGGFPGLQLRRPLPPPLGRAAEPHHRTLGVQVRGDDCLR